jgi:hypothetical protein
LIESFIASKYPGARGIWQVVESYQRHIINNTDSRRTSNGRKATL